MVNLQGIQTLLVLLVALVCSMVVAQSPVEQSELGRFQAVRERRANQMRNMMRIGRRSDPSMARTQPVFDYNNQNNEDYSHLFRPNGFF